MTWRTLSGKKIPDIKEFVRENAKDGQIVHIGTDSLPGGKGGKYTTFVTVVAILTPTKGGRVAHSKKRVTRITSLREQLLKETWESVALGIELHPVIPGELNVHIDASPDLRFKSSKYVHELVGMVVANGFKALIKPDSWCSTHVADHIVRHVA